MSDEAPYAPGDRVYHDLWPDNPATVVKQEGGRRFGYTTIRFDPDGWPAEATTYGNGLPSYATERIQPWTEPTGIELARRHAKLTLRKLDKAKEANERRFLELADEYQRELATATKEKNMLEAQELAWQAALDAMEG